MSILAQALRKITSDKPATEAEPEVISDSDLEQAMSDFQNATTPKDRAAAFRAALELAK